MNRQPSRYDNEADLVQALKEQDMQAFDYLYDNYSNALFGVINRVVQSDEIAEDVLQESFVKIWKNIAQYSRDKGSLFTWMLNLCKNNAIDMVRSKGYKKATQNQNLEDNVYHVDTQGGVSMKVDHIGLKEQLNRLKPEHRVLIDKIYFEGYTQEEVSKELDIPLGTVKTRLRAAMVHLRSVIVN